MNNEVKYRQIFPKLSSLTRLIKLYYVQSCNDPEFSQKITYFPNFVTTINAYQQSRLSWDTWTRIHSYEPTSGNLILLVTKFDHSRTITTHGLFNKISIVFNPLGLNHFLPKHLAHYCADNFTFFDVFGLAFEQVLNHAFAVDTMEEKRDLLDAFFAERLSEFNQPQLSSAVKRVLDSDGDISVGQLASEHDMSRKTILRLFRKHLCYSPTEYKAIVKFRKVLQNYQRQAIKPKMSSLAYDGSYYDQSDLNFHFKHRTGLTPKQLLSEIQTIEKDLYWKIEAVPKIQVID